MWLDPEHAPTSDSRIPQAHGCPACGADGPMVRVADCESVHWLCDSCGRCWRVVAGELRGVDVLACPGCGSQPKESCLEILSTAFPRFGTTEL